MAVGKNIFTTILRDAEKSKKAQKLGSKSLSWFRRKVKSSTKGEKVSTKSLMSRKDDLTSKVLIGKMFHFKYDPKTKEQLPYYDIFPLVIPIEIDQNSILGLNLHYLPPRLRAKLMDKLFDTMNDKKLSSSSRLRVTYKLLAGAARYKYFRPTLKRYLNSHVRSRFLEIPPEEWQIALFLPTQRFQKSSEKAVWKDSRKIARKG